MSCFNPPSLLSVPTTAIRHHRPPLYPHPTPWADLAPLRFPLSAREPTNMLPPPAPFSLSAHYSSKRDVAAAHVAAGTVFGSSKMETIVILAMNALCRRLTSDPRCEELSALDSVNEIS
mmetsp:Transcript_24175/g.58414  ORF Transcript_24175/g.58414 Transcript_24175/m.58414 type:complete len:119 (-) Transcript_24175:84-440(-)